MFLNAGFLLVDQEKKAQRKQADGNAYKVQRDTGDAQCLVDDVGDVFLFLKGNDSVAFGHNTGPPYCVLCASWFLTVL